MDESVFIVLADLHLGADFDREAELPPLEHPRLSRMLGAISPIDQFFKNNCTAHDQAVVASLPRYLTKLLLEARAKGFRGESFDLFLLLGDLVTWPSNSAYDFAFQYVTRESCNPVEDVGHCAGLKVSADRIISVPGNHDKLLQQDLSGYHGGFVNRLKASEYPAPRRSHLISKRIKGRDFLFIVVDANVYAREALALDWTFRSHLAAGEVSGEMISEVRNKLAVLRKGRSVDDADLSDYETADKILLLHYAVDYATVSRGIMSIGNNLALPHASPGASQLVKELRNEIRLAIHGHLHVPMLYRCEGVPVMSVASATQRGARNGFFVLRFSDGEVRADHHVWQRTGFKLDTSDDLTRSL